MKKIAVIYYSRTGNTKAMAKILADSINETKDVNAELFDVSDFEVKDMPSYDGFIIGSPTYYGDMSYEVKKLFDESVSFHGKLRGKVGAAFSSAGHTRSFCDYWLAPATGKTICTGASPYGAVFGLCSASFVDALLANVWTAQ